MADNNSGGTGAGGGTDNNNCPYAKLVGKRVIVKETGMSTTIIGRDPGGARGHLICENYKSTVRTCDLLFLRDGLSEADWRDLREYFTEKKRKNKEFIMPEFVSMTLTKMNDNGDVVAGEGSVLSRIMHKRVVQKGKKEICVCCRGEVPEGSVAVDHPEDEGEDEDEESSAGRKRKAVDLEDDLEGEGGARKRRPGRVSLEKGDVDDDEDDDEHAGEVAGEDMGTLMAALLANVKAYKARLESGGELSEEEVDEKVAERCRTSMRLLAEQHHEIMLPSFLRLLKEYREKEIDPPSAELAVAVVKIRDEIASREKTLEVVEGMPTKKPHDVEYEDRLKADIKREKEEQKSKIGEMKELELNLEEKAKEMYDEGKRQYAVSHVPTPEKSKRRLSEILSEQTGAASEE